MERQLGRRLPTADAAARLDDDRLDRRQAQASCPEVSHKGDHEMRVAVLKVVGPVCTTACPISRSAAAPPILDERPATDGEWGSCVASARRTHRPGALSCTPGPSQKTFVLQHPTACSPFLLDFPAGGLRDRHLGYQVCWKAVGNEVSNTGWPHGRLKISQPRTSALQSARASSVPKNLGVIC